MKIQFTPPPKLLLLLVAIIFNMQTLLAQQLAVTLNTSNFNGKNISCFGGRNGTITANPSGGSAPYTYTWSNQATTNAISNQAAGYYRVTVRDFVGAIVTAEVTLTEPVVIRLSNVVNVYGNGFNISCYNCYNGSINLTVTGGTTPYIFNWNGGNTNQNRTALGPGNYMVTVTDANGCSANSETFYLNQPERSDWSMTGNTGSNPTSSFIGTMDNVDLKFRTNNVERLSIKANGEVKINSSLQVKDSLTFNGNRQIGYRPAQGSNPEILSFGKAPFSLPTSITDCFSPNLNTPTQYQFAGTIQLYGNSTSNNNLNVMEIGFDGSSAIIDATGSAPNPYNRLLLNYYCGRDVFVGNNTSGDLTANHNFFVNGMVGIGIDPANLNLATGATPYKLLVAGKMGANEIWCSPGTATSPWPDYVFNKDYKMLSIKELEHYLTENNHLPGIASAKEINNLEKINLVEMQKKQQEKIEELYLYIIELKKEIDGLKNKLK